MPPRKRADDAADDATGEPRPKRRSFRQAAAAAAAAAQAKGAGEDEEPKRPGKARRKDAKPAQTQTPATAATPLTSKTSTCAPRDAARRVSEEADADAIPTTNPEAPRHQGEWYWLMKAEPESRLENGVDVRFSIDDLRAKTRPEGWDGKNPGRRLRHLPRLLC